MTMLRPIRRVASVLLLATLSLTAIATGPAAPAAAAPAEDRVTNLPQSDNTSGPRVKSALTNENLGYTIVLQQFKKPLVTAALQRTLPKNDTVLSFIITWRHGQRQLSGLLHAFRHGTQLHLAVHQKVYLTDRTDAAHQLVPFGLEGAIRGVRSDAKGFLIGTRLHVDFNASLPGDAFGNRTILEGALSVQRIAV